MLRSQLAADQFWVVDAWTDQYSLESAAIMLRTLSSVAGLVEAPREIPTVQVPVGAGGLVLPGSELRLADDPLPFFLIAETHVKPVCLEEYLTMQDVFTRDLELEAGFRHRRLLRDIRDAAHFLVVDEWHSEREAYEAFERRQATVSEITMTRYLSLLAERGKHDFALGIHA